MKSILITKIYCILTVLLLLGCNKNKCSDAEKRRWIMQSPMQITPQAEEIRLGDTLILSITIPYNNIDLRSNTPVNIKGCKISEFGLDFVILNKTNANTLLSEGKDRFKVVAIKGISRSYTEARFQNSFLEEQDGYVYKAYIIPLKKGLVNIANYRVEATLEENCSVIDFTPVCVNNSNNYDLQYQFMSAFGSFDYFNLPNRYHVWVK
jgi:hypothetical protein